MTFKFSNSLTNRSKLWGLIPTSIMYCLITQCAVQAQITEDGTTSTEVTTENSRDFTVNSGEQRGNNLFHSFDEFSIPDNGSVSFDNAVTIQNIITRVTGSSISEIQGSIQSNGMANLFLINPNGIIFGENATLDIGGSFVGTTAESLLFADGTEYSTNLNNSQSSLLTVSVPLGLQFGSNPGEIINQANNSILNPFNPTGQDRFKTGLSTPAKTLALFSNGITFDGGAATASGGNIQLGSVGENSFVALEPVATGWQANYEDVEQFQDLEFDSLASVDTSGEGGGSISVVGRNIEILNGSAITSNTFGNIDGEIIQIRASETLEVRGSDPTGSKLDLLLAGIDIFLPFSSQITSNTSGSGKGGDVNLIAKNLRLLDGGTIELQAFSGSIGNSGDLFVSVSESIDLAGTKPLLGIGKNAEDFLVPTITLDVAIEINQGSQIGNRSLSNASGGNILITAENVSLRDGSSIVVTPFNNGNAGDININSRESLQIIGISPRTGSVSSVISSNTLAAGNSGNVNIETRRLMLIDGGQILSSTNSIGDAGDIEIDASLIEISGLPIEDGITSLISAQATNEGDGGNIFLNSDRLIISDRGSLSVRGSDQSVPGNLVVNAKEIELSNSAKITAETEFESGGNIELNVRDSLTLRENSLISARAFNNASGGNLDIDTNFIIAFPQENNDILANAEFGKGGNITVTAEGILGLEERPSQPPNQTNDLDASSKFGDAGTVELEFPDGNSDNTLTRLDSDYVDVEYLFKNSFCKVRDRSQFIATGRGGIPQMPDDRLLPEHTWTDWRIVEENESTATAEVKPARTAPKQINLIQGWVRDSSGNIVLTDKPLVAASSASELKTPDCNDLKDKN